MSVRRLPTHQDERGRLLVAEDAEVGFPVRRAFVVTAVPAGATRGDHVVPCRQVMVLISGQASVQTAPTADAHPDEHRLAQPGDAIDLAAGVWVRYTLSGPDAAVLVLAERPFEREARS